MLFYLAEPAAGSSTGSKNLTHLPCNLRVPHAYEQQDPAAGPLEPVKFGAPPTRLRRFTWRNLWQVPAQVPNFYDTSHAICVRHTLVKNWNLWQVPLEPAIFATPTTRFGHFSPRPDLLLYY